jgi:hypothetical protein
LQRKSMAAASVNAELLGRHFGSGNAVCYLLERDVARIVRRAVIGLGVDAEWREATIVGRAEALLVDIFGGSYQLIANQVGHSASEKKSQCLPAFTASHSSIC